MLRTLTVSYSDDTIYALAVTLSFLHLAFHDYSYANTTASGHFQVWQAHQAKDSRTYILRSMYTHTKCRHNVFCRCATFCIDSAPSGSLLFVGGGVAEIPLANSTRGTTDASRFVADTRGHTVDGEGGRK